jgi:hypothetical protein
MGWAVLTGARRLVMAGTAALLAAAGGGGASQAAESASGAYVLGIRGPGAGITPPPGLFFSNQVFIYNGRIRGNLRFEGGTLASQARVSPVVNIPTLLWVTPFEIAGARLGTSLTVPFGQVEVNGRIGPIGLSDRVLSFADPSVGLFLGSRAGQFHWQVGVTAFLPIGDYRRGALANISKNRGALDIYGALTWLEPTLGLDVTNVVGVTLNTRNEATRYLTGTEFHWEWAVSKKFENGFSVGAVGYLYQQLSGDSGPGAVLGPFKGRTAAVGATVGYDFKVGEVPISTRIRFYHEVESQNRLRGNAAFLSVSMPLWVPGAR